jgi:hypothetical protein
MLGQSSPNSFYDYPCDTHALAMKLLPSANGLPWSLCEKAVTGITSGNFAMLMLPIVFIILNCLYTVAWIG